MQSSEIIVVLVVFAFAGFVLSLFAARDRAQIRYRTEVQKELIAKFSSSQELAEFLNSEAGKLLIVGSKGDEAKHGQQGPPKTAKEIVGLAVAWGVLILAVGGAIFAIHGLTMGSALLLALGIGFQVNAVLGYLFSKKWGTWDLPAASTAARNNGS